MHPLLSIQGLSVDFEVESGTTHALDNISFDLKKGEILAIVGESGSGKSVTALSILRLLAPSARTRRGKILFSEDGELVIDLAQEKEPVVRDVRGNKVAMIFQEPMTSLNPVLTCGQQVAESLRVHKKISHQSAKHKTIEWFQRVRLPDPANLYKRYPHQLSGGQKQRVMIAMAMCCHPQLLICDEPTTALDVTVQKTILELVKDLRKEHQMGVLFITHDLGVVAEVADRAIVMYEGKIVESNTVRELFTNPKHPYTRGLLACRPALHKKGDRLPTVSDFLKKPGIDPHHGSKAQSATWQPAASPQTLLEVKNLSVLYPSKRSLLGRPVSYIRAVDQVSFSVKQGETVGLVGESGCGKTTLGRAILRLIEPDTGSIIYNGIDLTAKSRDEMRSYRRFLQIIFQDPYSSLNPRMTIGSAISEALQVNRIVKGNSQRRERVVELLEKVNLEASHFNRYPHEFSGGQRQRIVIARALALNPSFIVCDEAVSALDVSVQAQVLNLLNDIKREFGFTVIFISHDLSVVRYTSDRILVMNKGRIVEEGESEQIYHHPRNEYTKKLVDAIPSM